MTSRLQGKNSVNQKLCYLAINMIGENRDKSKVARTNQAVSSGQRHMACRYRERMQDEADLLESRKGRRRIKKGSPDHRK